MQDYRSLIGWQKAHQLVKDIYHLSAVFPSHEMYGLTSQVRRSSLSIPTNIAEGSARGSNADFARFVQIALGSAAETEYLLLLAFELGYYDSGKHQQLSAQIEEIKKVLNGFLKKLKTASL
jgi:four helix bundle protein